jgi:predicted ABC-type ATPase
VEAVIFVGVQAAGKTTFYRERFFDTHVRISLDMLKTRPREQALLRACLAARQPFVVDNTNPTAADRARYVAAARAAGFRVAAYFFRAERGEALRRNRERGERGGRTVPIPGLLGTFKRLEEPTLEEGFDQVYEVAAAEGGGFTVVLRAGAPPPPASEADEDEDGAPREGVEL